MPNLVIVRLRPSGGIKAWIRGRKLADSLAASWLLGYLVYRVLCRLRKELDVDEGRILRPNLPKTHPFRKKLKNVKPWEARGCVMPDAIELIAEDGVDADEVAEVAREAVDDALRDILEEGCETPWESRKGLYEPLLDWWKRVAGKNAPGLELPPGLIGISVAVVDLDDPEDEKAYREAVRRVASLLGTRVELMDAHGSEGQPCSVCGEYPIVGDRRLWVGLRKRLPPQILKEWPGGVERLCAACLLKRYFGTHLIRSWYSRKGKISWIPSTAEVAITPVKVGILNRREKLAEDERFREAAREFLKDALPEQLRELSLYLERVGDDRAKALREEAEGLERGRSNPEDVLNDEDVKDTLRRLTPKAPKLEEELDDVDDPLILGLLYVEGKFWYEHDLVDLLEAEAFGEDLRLEDLYTPYYALLKLDGDKMGELFSRDPDTTRKASRSTIEFGLEAMKVVYDHYGALLYCGGDDVFAVLPLHTAFDCAFELEEAFRGYLSEWDRTCSAGLAVVHHVHPLRDAIDLAYRLEKRAKDAGRDRLAVGLYRRNAPERVATLRWEVDGKRPWELLLGLADLVSRRAAYHLPRNWWEGWWEKVDQPEDLLRSLLGYVTLRHVQENVTESEIVEPVGEIAEIAEEVGPEDGDPGGELGRALEIVLELRAECPPRGSIS